MTWTHPKTWTSEPLTSTDLNQYVRDNQSDLHNRLRSTALLRDEKAQSTDAGDTVAGSWQRRDLTIKHGDPANNVSLANHQFTLAAGQYVLRARIPAFGAVGYFQARLYNITAGVTSAYGTSGRLNVTGVGGLSHIETVLIVLNSTTFELHMQAQNAATNGLGIAAGFGTEVYSTVEIWKVAP